jgi:tRNA-dihydrouridine synthase B
MDGVTDAACRYITARYGKPGVIFTEFTAAEGLRAGADKLMDDFLYHPIERPIVAQLFGSDPAAFFGAAVIASALGFDGIDINMGCPAKNVTERGAGAALILDPERARAIIHETRQGTEAWAQGISLLEAGIHERLIPLIEERQKALSTLESAPAERRALPVSVKTRIGFDTIVIDSWVKELLEARPVAITIHGRTLKQLYTGAADWEAIAAGVEAGKNSGVIFLGNGDIYSIEDGLSRAQKAGTDGFLLGRHALGNPWVFMQEVPTAEERKRVLLEHATYLAAVSQGHGFVRIRKHLFEYTKSCQNARDVRRKLSTIVTLSDVQALLNEVAW